MKIIFRVAAFLFLIVVCVIGADFALSNQQTLVLSFFAYQTSELPVFIFLLGALGIGFLIGILCVLPTHFRSQYRLRRLNQRVEKQEQYPAVDEHARP